MQEANPNNYVQIQQTRTLLQKVKAGLVQSLPGVAGSATVAIATGNYIYLLTSLFSIINGIVNQYRIG